MTLPFLKPLSIYASRSETSAVFAFHKAEPPLVWRYDLTRDPTVTLTLHEHAKGVEVGFLRENGGFVRIVDFPEREYAEEALYKIANVIGAPFIRWGRVLLLSVVLAFAAFVITIVLSSYVAHTKLAPLVAEISAGNQFPSLPMSAGSSASGMPGVGGSGFPSLAGMPGSSGAGSNALPSQHYELTTTRPMLGTKESALPVGQPASMEAGMPVNADDVLTPPTPAH